MEFDRAEKMGSEGKTGRIEDKWGGERGLKRGLKRDE